MTDVDEDEDCWTFFWKYVPLPYSQVDVFVVLIEWQLEWRRLRSWNGVYSQSG